jgi:flagellar L-ring protein precursor FlgH
MKIRIYAAILLSVFLLSANAQSLYRASEFRPLVSDRRAYRVGDTLTVQIIETSSAQASADTSTGTTGSVTVGLTTPHGVVKSPGIQMMDQFDGKGTIQRSGKLLAQFTVVVESVDPGGLLNVRGDQIIDVNNERQEIRLEGKVRPVDINESNIVISTRIADAHISYIGDGILGEKQRPGILTRFLTWLRIL